MNLNDRAAEDIKAILESTGCASAVATIHYTKIGKHSVSGELGDIDSLLDKNEGLMKGRSTVFNCSCLSLLMFPEKGNQIDIVANDKKQTFYVSRIEQDRVLNVCRMILSTEPEPEYKD